MISGATISACQTYRYALTRIWGPGPRACWIMLNPSTADANLDDPTIRRCRTFSERKGCGSLVVVNLFALRSTNPAVLRSHPFPVGPEWREHFEAAIRHADGPIVAAWGAQPGIDDQVATAMGVLRDASRIVVCLGRTKDGSPRHPLYVRGDTELETL